MAFKFVLLVLLALALADIEVKLSGLFDGNASHPYISCTGQDVGLITDTERYSFAINDNALKNAVRTCFGKAPYEAFLKSPTSWGDLYKRNGWREVHRTLKPVKCKILKISSQPITVLQQVFENNSTEPATFDVGISQTVYNTFTSTWWANRLLSIEHDINYFIDITDKIGEITKFRNSSAWNKNTQWMDPVKVGASSAMKVTLQPGQAIVANLQAIKGSIEMQVEYEASLDGYTVLNYYYEYKGQHSYHLKIADCMMIAGINNNLMSQEVIAIGFYTDSKVIVRDRDRGYKLKAVSL